MRGLCPRAPGIYRFIARMAAERGGFRRPLEFGHFLSKMFLQFRVISGFILVDEAVGCASEASQDCGFDPRTGRGLARIAGAADHFSQAELPAMRERRGPQGLGSDGHLPGWPQPPVQYPSRT